MNEQLNALNLKYQDIKNILNEKDAEIIDLKEVTKALLDKQKNDLELKDKNERISPHTHFIISKKRYNQLVWYLVSIINPNDDKISNDKKNNYNNYKWVTELVIPKNQLDKYNKFIDEDSKNKIKQNKSLSVKNEKIGKILENKEKFGLNKSNSNKNVINIDKNIKSENNSIIDKIINYYDNRELTYKNEISKLETKIKNTEDFQFKTNDIKGISLENESNFIDFDESGGENIIKYLKDKNILKKKEDNDEDILKDIPGNESDLDEVKGLKTLTKYLKKDNKEKDKKLYNLGEKIKELINNLKYDDKIKPQISQILELLGFSSDKVPNILNNKKGFFSIQ